MDGASWSVDTIGPISRTVTDCAATIGAIAGHDPNDPYTGRVAVPDYVGGLTGNIRGLRVGVVRELMDPGLGLDLQTRDAVAAAADVLAELGADVKEVSLPLAKHTGAIVRTITHTERSACVRNGCGKGRKTIREPRISIMAATDSRAGYYQAQNAGPDVGSRCWTSGRGVVYLFSPRRRAPAGAGLSTGRGQQELQPKRW